MAEDDGKTPLHVQMRMAALRVAPDTPHGVVDYECAAIRQFMDKFGFLTSQTPGHLQPQLMQDRIELMAEELNEFVEAFMDEDLPRMADALIDLVYVTKGTAVQLGLPWEALMNDVHHANMRKERGVTKRGQAVDVCKPPGWVGPKTDEILAAAGYVRSDWLTEDGGPKPGVLRGYEEAPRG